VFTAPFDDTVTGARDFVIDAGLQQPATARRGDLLAILSAGAYGFSMAGNYNSRTRPAEVIVDGGEAHLVRLRESIQDLIEGECLLP